MRWCSYACIRIYIIARRAEACRGNEAACTHMTHAMRSGQKVRNFAEHVIVLKLNDEYQCPCASPMELGVSNCPTVISYTVACGAAGLNSISKRCQMPKDAAHDDRADRGQGRLCQLPLRTAEVVARASPSRRRPRRRTCPQGPQAHRRFPTSACCNSTDLPGFCPAPPPRPSGTLCPCNRWVRGTSLHPR